MRLKFEARKVEVRHRKQCTQWNKLEQKLQEKTQKQCNQYKEKMQKNPDRKIKE